MGRDPHSDYQIHLSRLGETTPYGGEGQPEHQLLQAPVALPVARSPKAALPNRSAASFRIWSGICRYRFAMPAVDHPRTAITTSGPTHSRMSTPPSRRTGGATFRTEW